MLQPGKKSFVDILIQKLHLLRRIFKDIPDDIF